MKKAFDKVRWEFLFLVLWDMGFNNMPSISLTLRVYHLLFVNDLLILSKESVLSAMNIKDTLLLFGSYYGLHANITKSFIFFSQSCENNNEILTIFRFQESSFPIQSLGLPLISKKLSYAIWRILLNKIKAKIHGWMFYLLS